MLAGIFLIFRLLDASIRVEFLFVIFEGLLEPFGDRRTQTPGILDNGSKLSNNVPNENIL